MSTRHTATLHHLITVYNNMFDHMDLVTGALPRTKTQWMEDLYFAVKIARQKLSKYYAEDTPTTSLLPIMSHILDSFRQLQLFREWDQVIDTNSEDKISYTIL